MRSLPLLLVAAVGLTLPVYAAVSLGSQEKSTVKYSPKADVTVVHDFEMKIAVGGMEAVVKSNLNTSVSALKEDAYDLKADFKDFKVEVGGSEQTPETTEIKGKLAKNGSLLKLEGGIQGTDNARTFLIGQFLSPDKELGVDESYTVDVAENKEGGIPAYKFEGKYIGVAEVNGQKGFKFETKLTETADGLSTTGTFVVNGDGLILTGSIKFKNLPLPIAGQNVEGSIEVKLKP